MNNRKHSQHKCVVDTNVPKTANRAHVPAIIPNDEVDCVRACVEAISRITTKGGLVIDAGDEILKEYRQQLSLSGQPGIGDAFLKWVHDNSWTPPIIDRVVITKSGDTYLDFPTHQGLLGFDRTDRKFVAVANKHPVKPPILEATDSKWWGYRKALSEVGIEVKFLCLEYVKRKTKKRNK